MLITKLQKTFQRGKESFLKIFVFCKHAPKKYKGMLFLGIFLFLFLTPQVAKAEPISIAIGSAVVIGLVSGIVGAVAGAFTDAIVKPITFLILVKGFILTAMAFGWAVLKTGSSMLKWAIGRPFGDMSMTNPMTNAIISVGWTAMRDLTNMFFILGLAYIGLMTALDLNKFDTKKTFARLLVVALIINFTPVICGAIVDGTNIVTNFFLTGVDFSKVEDIYNANHNWLEITADTVFGVALWSQLTMLWVFTLLTGVILWIFALLFLVRHIIIWLLVILSPIAFFLGIFDFAEAKKWHKKWWDTFIQWSIIAIPAGFMLYLTSLFMELALSGNLFASNPSANFFERFLADLTPYFIVGFFLAVSLKTTLAVKAAGSSIIMNGANRMVNKVVTLPGTLSKKASQIVSTGASAAAGGFAGGMLASSALSGKRATEEAKLQGAGFWGRRKAGIVGRTKGLIGGVKSAEERERGLQAQDKAYERVGAKWGVVKHGYAADRQAKRHDVEGIYNKIKEESEDELRQRIELGTNTTATKPQKDAAVAALRSLIENKDFNKEKDMGLLLRLRQKGALMDSAEKALKKLDPSLAVFLSPEKFEKMLVEKRLKTGEWKDKVEQIMAEQGISEEEAKRRVAPQIIKATDKYAKTQKEQLIQDNYDLQGEIQKVKQEYKDEKGKEIDDTKAEKIAKRRLEIKLEVDMPHIPEMQTLRKEFAQNQIDKLSASDLREKLNVKDFNVLAMLDAAQAKALSGANKKVRDTIDETIQKMAAENPDRITAEINSNEKFKAFMDYVCNSPAFLYGNADYEEDEEDEEDEEEYQANG